MKNHWRLSVPLFLLGFLLGTAAGTWTDKAAARRLWAMGADTEHAIKSMTAKYGLSAPQQTAIRPILEARRVRIAELHHDATAKFLQIRLSTKSDVDKVLDPGQREKYDAEVAQSDAKYETLVKIEK